MEEKVLQYIKNKKPRLATLATVGVNSAPEAALMTYAVLEDSTLTLVLSTRSNSRKWQNLKENKKIALVFGGGFSEAEVQYEGIVELFDNPQEYKVLEEVYFEQNPETLQFKGLPELAFIKIKPTWIRFTDYGLTPPSITEKSF